MKPSAFLFDLDGTLVDTEAAWTRAIVDLLRERGASASFEELLPSVIGHNWIDIDRFLHESYPEMGDSDPMEDATALRGHYMKYAKSPSEMRIEGSIAFFKEVSGIAPCAIVSGSPHDDVAAAAEMCGISARVSLILGAGEYARGKPDPSGYLRAAELLGAEPASCVVVEDSTVGVAAGVAAGMKTIALSRGGLLPQNFDGAWMRVADLSEIDVKRTFS